MVLGGFILQGGEERKVRNIEWRVSNKINCRQTMTVAGSWVCLWVHNRAFGCINHSYLLSSRHLHKENSKLMWWVYKIKLHVISVMNQAWEWEKRRTSNSISLIFSRIPILNILLAYFPWLLPLFVYNQNLIRILDRQSAYTHLMAFPAILSSC